MNIPNAISSGRIGPRCPWGLRGDAREAAGKADVLNFGGG